MKRHYLYQYLSVTGLSLVTFFILSQQTIHARTYEVVTPVFECLGNTCPTLPPERTNTGTGNTRVAALTPTPTSASQTTVQAPCDVQGTSTAASKKSKHKKRLKGLLGKSMDELLQFLIKCLNWLLKLLGMEGINLPTTLSTSGREAQSPTKSPKQRPNKPKPTRVPTVNPCPPTPTGAQANIPTATRQPSPTGNQQVPTTGATTPAPTSAGNNAPVVANAVYVAPNGNDSNAGTAAAPWRTVKKGLTTVAAGQTLYLRGGTYQETVDGTLNPGTASSRITMRSYPGEKAIINGHTTLSNPQFWTISDLEFIWPASPTGSGGSAAVLYVSRGNDWVLENLNVHNANYAGILVGGPSSGSPAAYNGTIRNVMVHDTGAVGLYFNPGTSSKNMLIERSLFWNNGTENVKLGWGGGSCQYGVGDVTFRYNTLHAAVKHFNLIIADPANVTTGKIDVYRNIFNKAPAASIQYDNAAGCLGNRSYVHDNAWSEAPKFSNVRGTSAQYTETNNVQIAPQFNSIGVTGFRPGNAQATAYGKFAQ